MLQVRVDHHDGIAARVVEAGREGYFFTEVPTEIDDSDRRIGGFERAQQPESIVSAAVIYENHLAGQRKIPPDQ